MHKRKKIPKRTPNRWLPILGGLAVLGAILGLSGFTFAATREAHDSFCASCHTQPESTFFERSTAAQAVDNASFHTTKQVRCIDCHSGRGITGRMGAELMGARNAFAWYTGTAVQPAKMTYAIGDQNCLKCHDAVTISDSRDNHFHYFLTRWQAADPSAAGCVTCHTGHAPPGGTQDPNLGYMDEVTVENACQACHTALGAEG